MPPKRNRALAASANDSKQMIETTSSKRERTLPLALQTNLNVNVASIVSDQEEIAVCRALLSSGLGRSLLVVAAVVVVAVAAPIPGSMGECVPSLRMARNG
eukprot:1139636-Pelagomonas_calceolata.AAC.5